jgi:transcriptional regulator with XRE-family HTH domain
MIEHGPRNDVQDRLAANLRRLRIARHLSLSELARTTGMSKATLSGIENGRANPTVSTLAALGSALRVSLSELLDESVLGEVRVVRRTQSPFLTRDGLEQRLLGASPVMASTEVSEIAMAPRQIRELPGRAPGSRAGVYVLGGLLLAGPVERITELGEGDCMTFPADAAYSLSTGGKAARALILLQTASGG